MVDWPALEDRVSTALVGGPLGEPAYYSQGGATPIAVRGVFSLHTTEVDPGTGLRILTDQPQIAFRRTDIATEPREKDLVTVRGVVYVVAEVREFDGSWIELRLHRRLPAFPGEA